MRDNHNRILLVDDHESTLEVLQMLLERKGFLVDAATTVASAFALAVENPYDLLISDIGLPDGSGIDLLRKIHQQHPIPAIAISGYGQEKDIHDCREAGYETHILKPFLLDKLLQAIEAVIDS